MKNRFWSKLTALFLAAAVASSMAACTGSNSGDKSNASAKETPKSAEITPKPAEKAEPLGKYAKPVDITTSFANSPQVKYDAGDSLENNVWTRGLKDELGINLKYAWSVNEDQYETKLNVSIASNDIPDFFKCNAKQLKMLTEADLIQPLDDIYNQWAWDKTKELVAQDEMGVKSAYLSGKFMGLPQTGNAIQQSCLLWIRKDWLDKAGLAEPKTMNDVFAIAEAFTKKDPDGNGKNDTFGLGLAKTLMSPQSGLVILDGFFNGYHAYPNSWVKDASGKIAYGGIQPEAKTALKKLQEMYAAGLIDKEFGVKDGNKVNEASVAGKLGMFYGLWWNGFVLSSAYKNDPKTDWRPYVIPSIDDKTALVQVKNATQNYFPVSKKCKNPEAVVKIFNFQWQKSYYSGAPTTEVEKYVGGNNKTEYWRYNPMPAWPANWLFINQKKTAEAYKTGDPSGLVDEYKTVYNNVTKFIKEKDPSQYGNYISFYFGFDRLVQIYDKKLYQYDEFYGAPTATMAEKSATLDKMQWEVYTNIILGKPIEEFDKFVSDWKKLGGDAITQEVNEWYKTKK